MDKSTMTRCLLVEEVASEGQFRLRTAGNCHDWKRATKLVDDVDCERCRRSAEYQAAVEVVKRRLAEPDQIGAGVVRKNIVKRFLTV